MGMEKRFSLAKIAKHAKKFTGKNNTAQTKYNLVRYTG